MRVEAPTFDNTSLKNRKPFTSLKETMIKARSVFGKSTTLLEGNITPFPLADKPFRGNIIRSGKDQALEALRKVAFKAKVVQITIGSWSVHQKENLTNIRSLFKPTEGVKGSERYRRPRRPRSPRCEHGRRKRESCYQCDQKRVKQKAA